MDYSGTLVSLLQQRVAHSGEQPVLHCFRQGEWRDYCWSQIMELSRRFAACLIASGVRPGDRVAQVAENRLEWVVCDFAISLVGAVHVPIHASLTGAQVSAQILDSGARLVVVSDGEKLAGLEREILRQPILCYDGGINPGGRESLPDWEALLASVELPREGSLPGEQRQNADPGRTASVLYTSGTTGEPTGVVLSHRNFLFNTGQILSVFSEHTDDLRLNFLPFSHVFARTCDLYTWIGSGCRLVLGRGREALAEDLAHWQPTLINGVPLFYERVQRRLQQAGRGQQAGALREALGGRVRLCISGGAALPDGVHDYYASQGVKLLQGYGLSETSPVVALSTPADNQRGSVGRPLPGVDVRLADDGEILTRGEHVMQGYYNRPELTRDVLVDGWLRTGDLGRWDEDGFLYVSGRKREVLVTAGGKNVAPAWLEAMLSQDPLIHQALVVGDGRDFLTALIVPDPETLRAQIKANRILVFSRRAALRNRRVRRLYANVIRQRLSEASSHEQVREFTLIGRAFCLEDGEVTPKMSLRRDVIEQHFRKEIDAMYRAAK